ncbi:hypothetical protein [Kineococcus sp. SYSU DK001]|uniref:hypothetical protein n=1 Tax=Kineococcus sp. SYSU DK001 TaxID=3383122 RepID=UPI003D7CD68F
MITVVCCVLLVTAAVLAAIHLEARWLVPGPAGEVEEAVAPVPAPAPGAAARCG